MKIADFANCADPDEAAQHEPPHLDLLYLSGYKTGLFPSRLTSNN